MLCDAMDGPLVALARKALARGELDHVLAWIRPVDEDETREAFEHALRARRLGGLAAELADLHFFETLARLHRAGEGLPYTGLKPAGADLGPIAPAAAQALETGLLKALVAMLTDAVRSGVHRRHQAAMALRPQAAGDVAAGRRYVEAYESYMSYIERLWQVATDAGEPSRTGQAPPHRHDVHAS